MVGVDIVCVSRIENMQNKDKFINKILTPEERGYLSKKSKVKKNLHSEYDYSLAGMWATKEAVLKAFGVGIINNLQQIEILHNNNGMPFVKIYDEFCKKYQIKMPRDISISVSHDGDYAVGVCFFTF